MTDETVEVVKLTGACLIALTLGALVYVGKVPVEALLTYVVGLGINFRGTPAQ